MQTNTTTGLQSATWFVYYQTARMRTAYRTAMEAWAAHDCAVCEGFNPDFLAVGSEMVRS